MENITEEDIKENIEEPLGDDDIKRILPDAPIMKYSRLSEVSNIDEILPSNLSYCIILYEDSPNKGHWICILRYNDNIEFFDPYGFYPDSQLKWNPKIINQKLNQKPFLTSLFDSSPLNIIYNPIKYQTESDDVNTCGRHCVWRIIQLIEEKKDLKEYFKMMKYLKNKTKGTYDQIVSFFINED